MKRSNPTVHVGTRPIHVLLFGSGRSRLVLAGAGLLAAAFVVAACGGSPTPSNGVATLDSPGIGASPATSAAPQGTDNSDQQLLAYSQCMRDHGVANFPDPRSNESFGSLLRQAGIDQSSRAFQAAGQACQSLLPAPPPDARQPMSPQDQAKWLQFSACIRSDGVPNWPDPDFTNGGPKPNFNLDGAGVVGSPTVDAAMVACRPLLPVISGGPDGPGGSGSTASASAPTKP
jgi:hypothetical protein